MESTNKEVGADKPPTPIPDVIEITALQHALSLEDDIATEGRVLLEKTRTGLKALTKSAFEAIIVERDALSAQLM